MQSLILISILKIIFYYLTIQMNVFYDIIEIIYDYLKTYITLPIFILSI